MAIFLIALTIGFFFLVDKLFDKIPDIKHLFTDNGKYFRIFLITAIVAYILTFALYVRTLDFFEAETKATINASIISVVTWTIIWVAWSIFCGWLTISFKPQTLAVKLTTWTLLVIPSLTAFTISHRIRKQQIKQEDDDKKVMGQDYLNSEPYTICLDKKYYSGYYALLCITVYLLTLLIGQWL